MYVWPSSTTYNWHHFNKRTKPASTKFNKRKIKQCLTTGDAPTTQDVVEDFGDDELEKLFAGDDIDEDAG